MDFIAALLSARLYVQDEKSLQEDLWVIFEKHGFKREYRLDNKNIPDFFRESDGCLIEVKVKGTKLEIYRQLERYAKFPQVTSVVLVTSKAMGLPKECDGKPLYYVNLSKMLL
jgi:hypothetical protein